MIDRYANEDITAIWSYPQQIETFKQIEALWVDCMVKATGNRKAQSSTILEAPVLPNVVKEEEIYTRHDVRAFLNVLSRYLDKETASLLHIGLTSSDIVDTADAIRVYESGKVLLYELYLLDDLVASIFKSQELFPVYTHGQYAGAVTLWKVGAGIIQELATAEKHADRALLPVGIGGPLGDWDDETTPELTAARRIFVSEVIHNRPGMVPFNVHSQLVSRQCYSDMAYHLMSVSNTLSRIASNLRFMHLRGLIKLYTSSSSAMPYKANPTTLEKVCGLARVARGYALMAFENTELWEMRDISNSSTERIWMPELFHTVVHQASTIRGTLYSIELDVDKARHIVTANADKDAARDTLFTLQVYGTPYAEAWGLVRDGKRDNLLTGGKDA